jgi:hypothetical protein
MKFNNLPITDIQDFHRMAAVKSIAAVYRLNSAVCVESRAGSGGMKGKTKIRMGLNYSPNFGVHLI